MAKQSNPSSSERDRQSTNPEPLEEADVSPEKGGEHPGAPTKTLENTPNGDRKSARTGRSTGEHISLKSIGSLERLRDRVENAAHELKRLREENQALLERIKELETRPNLDPHASLLSIENDPELLRRKINGFIEAIDRYLENERKRS